MFDPITTLDFICRVGVEAARWVVVLAALMVGLVLAVIALRGK